MTRLLLLLAVTIGGGVGWWLGSFVGIMTAFMMSVVGTAVAVYGARRFTAEMGL